MKVENALSYVISLRGYKQEALANMLKIKPENQSKYAKIISNNKKGRNKSVITNYCNRKRKLIIEDYILILEKELQIPREYWLDTNERNEKGEKNRNKGYVKRLSFEVKKEIDEYFKTKLDEMDSEAFREIKYNLFEKELLTKEKLISFDELINTINECIYEMNDNCQKDLINQLNEIDSEKSRKKIKHNLWDKKLITKEREIQYDTLINLVYECIYEMPDECREEYMYWQRINTLLVIMREIKRIGLDNMDECIKILNSYKPPKPIPMTPDEIKEYESLFGKIEVENTPE